MDVDSIRRVIVPEVQFLPRFVVQGHPFVSKVDLQLQEKVHQFQP